MTESSRAVFLSYASQDVEAAKRICEALRAGKIEVWFDRSELRGGDAWDLQIRKQIHDCALFIPVISATTQGREEGYFRREWKLGVNRTHDRSERRAFLVPVVIDDTREADADVPEAFHTIQWTRLPGGETPPAFATRIAQLLSPREPPASASLPRGPALASRGVGTAPSRRPLRVPLLLLVFAALLAAGYVGYLALDKFAPSKRASTAEAVTAPLEPASAPINEKSIAVLPFVDLSEKKDQEYFSDGLADELLDLLAKTPGLHVIARTSSFSFKGKSDDIPTIARKLRVANILEGSVRKSGDRLRVTTQLIRARDGEHLWSETYDRELKDVFAVQDEIAAAVLSQLKLKLAAAPGSEARRTSNLEAYNEDLLGRAFANRENLDGWKRAIEAFRRAIALDPNYVAPYDGLALAELYAADEGGDAAGYQRAKDAAAKAVALGPDDPNAYAARGYIRFSLSWDWTGAQVDFEKAITLDPGDARFQQRYGLLLAILGRLPEAITATRNALQLDPLQTATWRNLIGYLLFTRDFPAAEEANRRAMEISPESPFTLEGLALLQLLEGNAQDALATFRGIDVEAFRLSGIAMAEHSLKESKASQQALDELAAKHAGEAAYQIAIVHAWRGENDKAFDWLERAYAQHDGGLTYLKIDPVIYSIRNDPRYHALLRKMQLPE